MTIRQIVFSFSGDNAALHSHIFVPRDLFTAQMTCTLKTFVDSRGTNVKCRGCPLFDLHSPIP